MTEAEFLQCIGVIFWIIYLLLAVQENIWCWLFGILASAVTVFNFFESKIYSEAFVNVYYIGAAIYGWNYWLKNRKNETNQSKAPVHIWSLKAHFIGYISTAIFAVILGFFLQKYTDSPRPYLDAATASFSFLTTFMEARKVLTTWVNWFIINCFLVYLQINRHLYPYAGLSAFFAIMSIRGFYNWRKSYWKIN
jgi:nicotinamide mononucleotide transporter